MACGTVSVLTEVGGVNDTRDGGENALLVPPRDPDAAAQAILQLLSEPDLSERLRITGSPTVCDYSIRRKARETLEFLERLGASSVAT